MSEESIYVLYMLIYVWETLGYTYEKLIYVLQMIRYVWKINIFDPDSALYFVH